MLTKLLKRPSGGRFSNTHEFLQPFFMGVLVLLVLVISLTNYVPGTWLSGWDNLHPEFNFALNIQRSISASWQEYQGLGLLGGMGHASDLPRQVFLWLCSLVLPTSSLRYFWMFCMLLSGAIGAFFLLKELFLEHSRATQKHISTVTSSIIVTASFLGALYYLLNLGTVQNFYVPFEAFTTQYGILPWLLLTVHGIFKKGKFKSWLWFALASFAIVPQAYVPTTFIVFLVVLSIWLVGLVLTAEKKGLAIRQAVGVGVVTFLINAFWMLSFVYFALTNAGVAKTSKINLFSTQDTYLQNKEYGTLKHIFQLEGYWLSLRDAQADGSSPYLMSEWREYNEHDVARTSRGFVTTIIVAGFILLLLDTLKKKKFTFLSIVISLLLFTCIVMLGVDNPPLGIVYTLLSKVPLFSQVFRSPFTKWSIPLMIVFSILFAQLFISVFTFLHQMSQRKYLHTVSNFAITIATAALLIAHVFPIFQGHLFNERTRIHIPDEYFKVFTFFQTQPKETRIANFPQHTLFGWQAYPWGYRGSGFLWYGIEQPIIDRAFDVWSETNEAYYTELHNAIYSDDQEAFFKVLQKYDVKWVMIDQNFGQNPAFAFDQIESYLKNNKSVGQAIKFNNITIYPLLNEDSSFIQVPATYSAVTSSLFTYQDQNPASVIEDDLHGTWYPFNNLTEKSTVTIAEQENVFSFTLTDADAHATEKTLQAASPWKTEQYVPGEVQVKKVGNTLSVKIIYQLPEITIGIQKYSYHQQTQEVELPLKDTPSYLKVNDEVFSLGTLSTTYQKVGNSFFTPSKNTIFVFSKNKTEPVDISTQLLSQPVSNCGQWRDNNDLKYRYNSGTLNIEAKNMFACVYTKVPSLSKAGDFLYAVEFEAKSTTGSYPNYYLLGEKLNQPFNHAYSNAISYTKDQWKKYQELTSAHFAQGENMWFQVVLDAYSSDELQDISYRNVKLTQYALANKKEFVIDKAILEQSLSHQEIKGSTTSPDTVVVTLPKVLGNLGRQDTQLSERNSWTQNSCKDSSFRRPDGVASRVSDQEGILYTSLNSNNCDFWQYSTLSTNTGYLLSVTHQNLAGKPLQVCLYDSQSYSCRVQTKLLSNTSVITQHFVVPPKKTNDQSYSFHIDTQSLGNVTSQNKLYSVEMSPIMYNWLSQLHFTSSQNAVLRNPAQVISERKIGTFAFMLQTKSASGTTIVALEQEYHPLWWAVTADSFKSLQVLPHRKYNSWANAWNLPNGEHAILILFMPQLLTCIGYVLLMLTVIYFGVRSLFALRK